MVRPTTEEHPRIVELDIDLETETDQPDFPAKAEPGAAGLEEAANSAEGNRSSCLEPFARIGKRPWV